MELYSPPTVGNADFPERVRLVSGMVNFAYRQERSVINSKLDTMSCPSMCLVD